MLLLINNAMVFYLKNMREYKCATLLRDMVCSTWRHTPEETSRGQVSIAAVVDPPPIPTMDISTTPAEDTNKLPGKVKATKNGPLSMPRGSRRAPIPTPLLAWRNQEVGKRNDNGHRPQDFLREGGHRGREKEGNRVSGEVHSGTPYHEGFVKLKMAGIILNDWHHSHLCLSRVDLVFCFRERIRNKQEQVDFNLQLLNKHWSFVRPCS
ncbi:hypothetical protein MLD38_029077 [Melastoma candidum]|uniref:Uncharacterized protein n=1 Tax=Melastoma candidum TaxID=119954 RepID=A0ACB9N8K5_9MYRT|nr:hypothetical protein MLD38_029077 [Melastoma candidum]